MFALRFITFTGLFLGLVYTHALSAENWGLCRIPSYQFFEDKQSGPATEIEADRLARSGDKVMVLSGNVVLNRESQQVDANRIEFDENTEQLRASGDVLLTRPSLQFSADSLSFDQINESGELIGPSFQLSERHGSGSAGRIEILDRSRSSLENFLYTACDPGDRDWHFTGSKLELDDESGRGEVYHATIYFQEVPIFYFPYFQFPIDDRRMSGVLTPTISLSDSDNSHLAVPVYWNIAPNFDTTFTPAWYTERGFLYNGEHRYLFEHSRGQVDYLRIEDDLENETRWFKKWRHQDNYADYGLSNSLLLQEVSDEDFIGDFDRLTPGSDEVNHLDRHYRIDHSGENWRSSLMWQNYQTVKSAISIANRPYQRLPRLSVSSRFKPMQNGLRFNIDNELVRFKRESSVNGDRAHISPSLGWSSSNSWYYFKPQVQYTLTDYSLDNNNLGGNSIQRAVPITSLDSGLFFERVTGPGRRWLQTLEPRLYFVHVPFEEQADIPDFDTALLAQSYANFFRPNRFSGFDRIGDTEQVTFGLGTRFFDNDSGEQLFYARVAQIFYADDRKVSLNGVVDESERSNIIGQLFFNPNRYLTVGSELVYNEDSGEYPERDLSINWAKDGYAVNLEYHAIEERLEQSILSFVYPVNERWTLIAKYHQSLLFDKPVENLLGVNYESCCWGLKILASQVSDDDFEETDQALFFELTLKGLTQAGKDIDERLSRVIPGYRARF